MKKALSLMAGAFCLVLAGCSNDEPGKGSQTSPAEGDVFAQLTLKLPQTRSTTTTNGQSTNGNEFGKDYENNVESIRVVLALKSADGTTYTYGAQGVSENAIHDQSQSTPTYSIIFQSEELEQFAGKTANPGEGTGAGKEVYVFAYCNPSIEVINFLDGLEMGDNFVDQTAAIASDAEANDLPWAQANKFMMTNASTTSVTLPNYQTLIRDHNTKATAFPLGVVNVERVVSRFDFEATTGEGASAVNQYLIKDNISGLSAAYVEINGMSLINEAKEFYLLPRVSNNTDWTAPIICGSEIVTNWMVSPNFTGKLAFAQGGDYSAISENYYFANALPNMLVYTMPSTNSDNDGWTGSEGTNYKIWRYATENTMPTIAMKKGITTGIVFRAEIKALTDAQISADKVPATPDVNGYPHIHPGKVLKQATEAKKAIYAWTGSSSNPENNVMLGSAKDVWVYAYTHPSSAIRSNFVAAVAAGNFNVKRNNVAVTTAEDLFPKLTADQTFEQVVAEFEVTGFGANTQELKNNFMVYMPTTDGHYYVYYRYYNRHNDNSMADLMCPMEFATVRNNIYKLKVSKVAAFGLPGDLPTPPGTDDETPEVYFKVSVKVLDWVVRVNNIEF